MKKFVQIDIPIKAILQEIKDKVIATYRVNDILEGMIRKIIFSSSFLKEIKEALK